MKLKPLVFGIALILLAQGTVFAKGIMEERNAGENDAIII